LIISSGTSNIEKPFLFKYIQQPFHEIPLLSSLFFLSLHCHNFASLSQDIQLPKLLFLLSSVSTPEILPIYQYLNLIQAAQEKSSQLEAV